VKNGLPVGADRKPNGSVQYPTGTILEIAPGYGRWTNYLKDYCENFIGVDLAENCIKTCQERFSGDSHMTFHVNDGKSLAMLEDKSIDFVFSFDSLVHANPDVIETYLNQLAIKLKDNGIGFIHHSNFGSFQQEFAHIDKIPLEVRDQIINRTFLGPRHWRAADMSAKLFADYCDKAGLQCIGQELLNWGTDRLLIDSFSLFTPKNSIWSRPNQVVENPDFMKEANMINKLSNLYTGKSFQYKNEGE
jgi:SAM-dependent methyltransferase